MPDTNPACRTAFRSYSEIVRHPIGTLSGITPECCPPSARNPVRHGPDYAIKLSLANLASAGLKLLEKDLLGAGLAATKLQTKLSALKMIAVGYGLEKAGSQIFGFLEKSIDASKEYTAQLSLMNAAGMSQRDIALSTAAAWATSKSVLTSTAADNLKALRELRSVFGVDHMDEAISILPTVQRTKGVMEALTGKPQENVAFDMVKAIEMRTPGVMTKEAMQKNADLMSRTLMAFGGTLNVNDFHMAMKQLKTAAFGFDDEFVYDYLPTMIQEAKTKGGSGSSAATALRTMMNTMIGGVGITKSSIPLWEEMGLIKPSDVVKNSTGQFQLKPGSMKDSAMLQADPLKWAEKHGAEIAAIGEKHHLSLLQTVMALTKNTNAQWALYTLLVKQSQFERDKKLIESGGTSIETYQKLLKTNPELAEQALHSQWQNLLSIIGFQILPRLIPYMVKFADMLDRVSQWMAKNASLTMGLVTGLAGVALAFSVIGKVLMTAGMIKFLGLGPSITAAASALGTVALGIAAITAAVAAAWWIQDHFHWDQAIGEWVNDKINGKYDPNAKPAAGSVHGVINRDGDKPGTTANKSTIAGKGGGHVTVHTHINIDGKKVAEAVSKVQGKDVSGPVTGIDVFDWRQSALPAGGVGY